MAKYKPSLGLVRSKEERSPLSSRDVQSRIDERLRAMHDEIVQQGVPRRFVDHLAKVEREGRPGKEYWKK